ASNDVVDDILPLLVAHALAAGVADIVLETAVLFVRQVTEFHRCDGSLDDEGRAQAGAQAEEEHAAAVVAAQGLHGGIVDELDRFAEGDLEIEIDPAAAEVDRLQENLFADHRAGVADADGVELPVTGGRPDVVKHGLGGQLSARRELADLLAVAELELDVSAAD